MCNLSKVLKPRNRWQQRRACDGPAVVSRLRARNRWKEFCAIWTMLGLPACTEHNDVPPPPSMSFEGLPVSGKLTDALKAGFNSCITLDVNMRCRRNGVMIESNGPYNAAVDLGGSDGSGGFDNLTLWHDKDQDALVAVADELKRRGWVECLSGGRWGDQAIYTHTGSPVFISLDLGYWSKRRLRLFPAWNKTDSRCGGHS